MKKLFLFLAGILAVTAFVSCSDYETYAEKREKEDKAISKFLQRETEVSKELFTQPIQTITEEEFEKKGYVTDTTKNEYVLLSSTGVYLQIIRQGCGEKLKSGETATILCRFKEYNILGDSLQLTNEMSSLHYMDDKMTVTDSYGTFSGSFDTSYCLMYTAYSSSSVPNGWLAPLTYINIGRQSERDEEIAKVRIIVPSSQGQAYASSNTYPCFYELTYERGL